MKRVIHKCSKSFIFDVSYIYLIISQAFSEGDENGPKSVEPIPYVIVTLGQDASLPCVINNLGTYKVTWTNLPRQRLIAKHQWVVNPDKYSITFRNANTSVLNVTKVQLEDQGYYMCQVNTNPAISSVGYLEVLQPPVFTDDGTPSIVTVGENQNVNLTCRAKGSPTPKIVWKREDEPDIVFSRGKPDRKFSGETIHFEKISRNDMASYWCTASNGSPPSLTKKIFINVEFSPTILVTHQAIERAVGTNISLECRTEANPTADTFWICAGNSLSTTKKYVIETSQNGFTTSTKLTILNVMKSDFGDYKCVSKNALGETAGTITVNEYKSGRTSESVIVITTPVTLPSNKVAWEKNQSPEFNITPIFTYIYKPKTVSNNLGSELPTSQLLLMIFAIVTLVYQC